MDLKNANSKIYFLTEPLSVFIIIIGFIHFIMGTDTIREIRLTDMLLLSSVVNFILIGTRKTVAQNNKKGYFDYFLAIFVLVVIVL